MSSFKLFLVAQSHWKGLGHEIHYFYKVNTVRSAYHKNTHEKLSFAYIKLWRNIQIFLTLGYKFMNKNLLVAEPILSDVDVHRSVLHWEPVESWADGPGGHLQPHRTRPVPWGILPSNSSASKFDADVSVRRTIRLVESNAKCRHLKKLTCKGSSWQMFIWAWGPEPHTPPPLYTSYV